MIAAGTLARRIAAVLGAVLVATFATASVADASIQVSIVAPTSGAVYTVGQVVHADFACTETNPTQQHITQCDLTGPGFSHPGDLVDTSVPGHYKVDFAATESGICTPAGCVPGDDDVFSFFFDVVDSAYAAAVLADHPAGYWRFGEPARSTVLTDSSPNANNGTYLGGVSLGLPGAIAGSPNTAASFDGFNDYGRVPASATLDVGDRFTIEGWVKRTSTAKAVELMNKGANGIQLVIMNAGVGNQVWLRKAGVSTIAHSTGGVPADGKYHYIVVTKDGPNSTSITIDHAGGTVQVSGVQAIKNTAFPLTFGATSSTATQFDEFALYDHVLSPTTICIHNVIGVGGGGCSL